MRILAVLWTVCLVRLCYGGDNGKVDSTLFNVEEAEENAVKVLKLTPKKGAKATKLTYEGLTVWEETKKSCSSASLYFDVYEHTLAVLETRNKNNKQGTLYRYYNGKKWKSCKEKDHNVGLKKLKKKYRPTIPITLDLANPDDSKINVKNEEDEGVSLKSYTPKKNVKITSVVDGQTSIWTASGKE